MMKQHISVIEGNNPDNLFTEYLPGTFTRWVADNIGHNIMTLDGQGTFHGGMGIIKWLCGHNFQMISLDGPYGMGLEASRKCSDAYIDPAPDRLTNFVRCKCKVSSNEFVFMS